MEERENNIEALFYAETKEKKRIAANAHRIGSAVHRRCTMPHELLKGKEKKEYTKPMNEKTYKLEPMSLKDFKKLPEDLKPELLKWYGETFGWTTSAVALALSVSFKTANSVLERYNMATVFAKKAEIQTRDDRRSARLNREELIEMRKNGTQQDVQDEGTPNTPEPEKPATVEKKGTNGGVSYAVNLTCAADCGKTLAWRLRGIASSLDPEARYKVMLTLHSVDEEE